MERVLWRANEAAPTWLPPSPPRPSPASAPFPSPIRSSHCSRRAASPAAAPSPAGASPPPSLTLALAAAAADAGAWLAVVDVPWLGVEAAAELGVPLERLVRVEPAAGDPTAWADLVAAVLDGFELVVTHVPRRVNAGVLRRVQSRIQAREGVLLTIGDPGPLHVDVAMDASVAAWEGVDHGAGHLRGRRVTVVSSGRRIPRPRRAELWLPGPAGAVAAAEPLPVAEPVLRSVG